jgi:hypothetical protein
LARERERERWDFCVKVGTFPSSGERWRTETKKKKGSGEERVLWLCVCEGVEAGNI